MLVMIGIHLSDPFIKKEAANLGISVVVAKTLDLTQAGKQVTSLKLTAKVTFCMVYHANEILCTGGLK